MQTLREWMQFALLVVGSSLALVAFFQNLRQRRVENALKMVALFNDSLREDDLEHWENLFRDTSDSAGAKTGHYVGHGGQLQPLSDFFSEGSRDGHAVSRIAENLEIVCHEICSKSVEPRIVWFELGQLLRSVHDWLAQVPGHESGKSLLDESFPSIRKTFRRHEKRFRIWPMRTYAYLE